jgi:type IV pilus assembly protein PilW
VVANKAATCSEELLQGVENLQVQYGVDLDASVTERAADIYINADDGRMDWQKVRNVRVSLRLRSVLPVHRQDIAYDDFMGIPGTSGSDRFMRQTFSTTITLRN